MRKGARRKGGNMLRKIKVSLEPSRSGRGDFVGEQVSLVSAAAILSSLSFPFLLFCRVVNQARITRGSHCIVLRQGRRGEGEGEEERGRKKHFGIMRREGEYGSIHRQSSVHPSVPLSFPSFVFIQSLSLKSLIHELIHAETFFLAPWKRGDT